MKFALIILFVFISFNASAQSLEFGDIPQQQLEMEVYEKDSTAEAVVLFDVGETVVDYYSGSFRVSFKRHRRVKILTDEGLDYADVQLNYRTSGIEQELSDIKAESYTLTENGKVEKESVGRRDRFTEKLSDNQSAVKFTIPGARKGSVIEFSYELTTEDPFSFPDWYFQSSIPVIWSQYTAKIPEWFYYLTFKKGYQEYYVYEQNRYTDRVRFGYGTNTSNLDYRGIEYVMAMKDVPAIKEELFMKASIDYLAHTEFQLSRIQMPGREAEHYIESWADQVDFLVNDVDFGERLTSSSRLISEVSTAIEGSESGLDKMINIYNHLSGVMEWDETYGIYAFEELDDIFDEGTGDGAEINLLLVQMLREAGLDAYPLVLSTREHGEIIKDYPILNQFNHTIAYVKIDDQTFLLDAKNQRRPYNLLPISALNGEGLLVKADTVQWVSLKNNVNHNVIKSIEIELDSAGFSGTMEAKNFGYYAYQLRDDLDFTDLNNSFKELEFDIEEGLEVDSVQITNDKLDESFDYKAYFRINKQDTDIHYFNPMITEYFESNPFKLDDRTFPVDYSYTFDEMVILNLTIPEGWTFDEIPQSVLHRLPRRAGEFRRIIQQDGNKLTLNYRLRITKERFNPNEYGVLKELYQKVVDSVSEQIVIKKGG